MLRDPFAYCISNWVSQFIIFKTLFLIYKQPQKYIVCNIDHCLSIQYDNSITIENAFDI